VYVDIEIPFEQGIALGISCRKNVVFTEPRMPGGIATGKIMSYSLSLSGEGETACRIEFGCTVGNGNGVVAVAGNPEYIEDDYIEADYQVHDGSFILPDLGDVLYAPILGAAPNDDGLNFFSLSAERVIKSLTIQNGADSQGALFPLKGPITDGQPLGTWSQFYLVNLAGHKTGSFRPDYDPGSAINALSDAKTTVDLKLAPLDGGPFQTDFVLTVSDLMVPRLIDTEASSS
jgi:hypothetical protein